jgi:hypothetical protein
VFVKPVPALFRGIFAGLVYCTLNIKGILTIYPTKVKDYVVYLVKFFHILLFSKHRYEIYGLQVGGMGKIDKVGKFSLDIPVKKR